MGELWTRRRVLLSAAALPVIGAAACTDRPAGAQSSNTVAIRAVRVFDGERLIDADSVLVQGGVITAVGRN